MISTILSNGEFISFITNNTGNSSKFWDFLWILKYTKMKPNKKCSIMIDNSKIHHFEQTKKNNKEIAVLI